MRGMSNPIEKINLQPSHVRVYRYVEKYTKKNLVAPDVHEIAKAVGVTWRQVYRLIDDLCVLGYMTKEAHKKRSIKIVKPLK